eukprot:888672-Pyramimonas_sp.AAC.1
MAARAQAGGVARAPPGHAASTSSRRSRRRALNAGTEKRRPCAVPHARTNVVERSPCNSRTCVSCCITSSSHSQARPCTPAL